jgi:hypothetical protein
MFEIRCTHRPTASSLIFLPEDIESDRGAALRVSFETVAYWPAERDVGAGDDFDARIICVEINDDRDNGWRRLDGQSRENAEKFLETHYHNEMWEAAGEQAREDFAIVRYGWAA